ncbi:putative RNA 2'-phosphotransferase [Tenacibaculum mesophilum]|uniref:Probable RNA 2'-phosphotransferase n=1 Tax=Tenacibaculum mesophilum TaxID=104268 RepID=A0ABN5T8X5_9FLAO|nr:RNA 2'-phosphotransferase [Tenacibaculum mesophilum]AZJ33683.1 RNA 2'-phosphotransferase [Tenacibaculum mesophilum]QFS28924.1 RNA 2'-phosphotransferase [Tenacibaculum mesophilum]SHF55833.1 putative RNA 2'-phosphotransferase [Tenacibaculum mesophilum]
MNERNTKRISKFLSLILRHQPEKIGLKLDINGWASIEELLNKSSNNGVTFTKDELEFIVKNNDKQRFSLNENQTKIRANQGHSLKNVTIVTETKTPPPFLYHGTVAKFIPSIKENGLQKMSRQHVHLSSDVETAKKVGSRRGKPIILTVQSGVMHKKNYEFFLSENGVWLTNLVPTEFINFEDL